MIQPSSARAEDTYARAYYVESCCVLLLPLPYRYISYDSAWLHYILTAASLTLSLTVNPYGGMPRHAASCRVMPRHAAEHTRRLSGIYIIDACYGTGEPCTRYVCFCFWGWSLDRSATYLSPINWCWTKIEAVQDAMSNPVAQVYTEKYSNIKNESPKILG